MKKRNAFTLLELLVAMSLVAIVALTLFASLGIAFKAQAAAEVAIEPSRTANNTLDYLTRDIASAVPPGMKIVNTFLGITDTSTASSTGTTSATSGTTSTSAVTGVPVLGLTGNPASGSFMGYQGTGDNNIDADDLLFFGTADSPIHVDGENSIANGAIKFIELTVVTSGSDRLLIRRTYNNLLYLQGQFSEEPDEEVICRGVDGFNLQYWDPTSQSWLDEWDCTQYSNTLPAAVLITLSLDRTDKLGQQRTFTFTRVVQMPCAVAASLLPSSTGTSTTGN